jgi:hypothetical protein
MSSTVRALVALAFLVTGCAPTTHADDDNGGGDDGGGHPDRDGGNGFIDGHVVQGGAGTVTGTVWAPGNAPGMVPAGQEIPIADAVIYTSISEPPANPDHVYCQTCEPNPAGSTRSDSKGHFTLIDVPMNTELFLIIEKAQFRRVQKIVVENDIGLSLSDAQTVLPSKYDPANGLYIPKVAIAVGDSDHPEDIFGKMKILDVDASGRTIESSLDHTDHVDLYGNVDLPALPDDPGDAPFKSHHKGTIAQLFGSLTTMKKYHIIFVPCNYQSDVSQLNRPAVRKNIQDYVAAGGHLYVTDWAAEYEDAAFPDFIQFDQGGTDAVFESQDTTKAQADANMVNPGDGDFGHFARHAKAEDPGLRAWLDGQKGPLITPLGDEDQGFPSEYHLGTMHADDFVIEGAWDMIRALPTVNIGNDAMGHPIMQKAKVWISGDYTEHESTQTGRWPHTVTFEPTSCGRVLYSTYHTAEKVHPGLMAQERVLLYLILELGVCSEIPPIG